MAATEIINCIKMVCVVFVEYKIRMAILKQSKRGYEVKTVYSFIRIL